MLLDMNVKMRKGGFDLAAHIALSEAHTGLLGQAGAGKTAVLSMIAGTLEPQSGYIMLDGKLLYDSRKGIYMPKEQRPVGTVLHCDTVLAEGTVGEYLSAVYRRILKPRRLFSLSFLYMLLDLGPLLNQAMPLLSEADRYRVALAKALLKSPRLLLLDDTFMRIGHQYRQSLLPIIRHLQHEFGVAVFYASQSLGEILDLTDQLIVLEQGRVLRSGSLAEMARQHEFLRYLGLRQIDNVLPVKIREHHYQAGYTRVDCCGLSLRLPLRPQYAVGEVLQVSVRANDVALSLNYLEGISIQNQIKGRICAIIPGAGSVIVQIDCGHTFLAEITAYACHDLDLREGQIVYCLIKANAMVYLSELETLPFNRIINHNGQFYYVNAEQQSTLSADSLI
jgi:molybdate transport system ATP-binding protein